MTLRGMLLLLLCFVSAGAASAQSDLIGRKLWVVGVTPHMVGVEVARAPGDMRNTLKLRSGSLTVVRKVRTATGTFDHEVATDAGQRGWISASSFALLSTTDPKKNLKAESAECTRRGPPKIGMTPAQLVETCWRRPARIVKKTTASGIEESYVYGIGHVVKVTDGKVSEIVEAR